MRIVQRVAGSIFVITGTAWIVFIVVAVATGMDGFTTLGMLVPGLAFHAVSSAVGWHLLSRAAARGDALQGADVAAGAVRPGPAWQR